MFGTDWFLHVKAATAFRMS